MAREQTPWSPTTLVEPPTATECELCYNEKPIKRIDMKGDGAGHLDLGSACIRRLFGD